MAEKVKIKVHPSGTSADLLTVADAMRQVLDFVELLEKADSAGPGDADKIVWRLTYATTNSPFELGAEATSKDPSLTVSAKAHFAKMAVRGAIVDLTSGRPPPAWLDESGLKIAERIFHRNLNGIGRTDLDFGESSEAAIIVHSTAKAAALAIDEARIAVERSSADLTRTEYGSFEGEIVSAGMYHNNPSLVVRDRLTGEKVTCVFPPELSYRIGTKHNWHEVWAGHRVLVHGELHYTNEGVLRRSDAIDLEVIESKEVDLAIARKEDILEGLSPSEFSDRSWGNG